jgi:hypothetical protein
MSDRPSADVSVRPAITRMAMSSWYPTETARKCTPVGSPPGAPCSAWMYALEPVSGRSVVTAAVAPVLRSIEAIRSFAKRRADAGSPYTSCGSWNDATTRSSIRNPGELGRSAAVTGRCPRPLRPIATCMAGCRTGGRNDRHCLSLPCVRPNRSNIITVASHPLPQPKRLGYIVPTVLRSGPYRS